jgi:adenylyltransferase/sulfurtransferase
LDIREPHEVAICQIANSIHIPMMDMPNHLNELPRDTPIVLYCHLGIRSASTIRYLMTKNFNNLIDLDGGIENWALTVDPEMARY